MSTAFTNPASSDASLTSTPDLDAAFDAALAGEELGGEPIQQDYEGNGSNINSLPFGDEGHGQTQPQPGQPGQPGQPPVQATPASDQPTQEDIDVLFDLVANPVPSTTAKPTGAQGAQGAQGAGAQQPPVQPAQPAQPAQPPQSGQQQSINYDAPLFAPAQAKQVHEKYVEALRNYATTGDVTQLEQFNTDITRYRVMSDPVIQQHIEERAMAVVRQMLDNDPRIKEAIQVTTRVGADQMQREALADVRGTFEDFDRVMSAKARVKVAGADGKPVIKELPIYQAIRQARPDVFEAVILGPNGKPDPRATKRHHMTQAYRMAQQLTATTRVALASGAEAGAANRATTPSGSTASRRNVAPTTTARAANDLTEDLRPYMSGGGHLPFGS